MSGFNLPDNATLADVERTATEAAMICSECFSIASLARHNRDGSEFDPVTDDLERAVCTQCCVELLRERIEELEAKIAAVPTLADIRNRLAREFPGRSAAITMEAQTYRGKQRPTEIQVYDGQDWHDCGSIDAAFDLLRGCQDQRIVA